MATKLSNLLFTWNLCPFWQVNGNKQLANRQKGLELVSQCPVVFGDRNRVRRLALVFKKTLRNSNIKKVLVELDPEESVHDLNIHKEICWKSLKSRSHPSLILHSWGNMSYADGSMSQSCKESSTMIQCLHLPIQRPSLTILETTYWMNVPNCKHLVLYLWWFYLFSHLAKSCTMYLQIFTGYNRTLNHMSPKLTTNARHNNIKSPQAAHLLF